MIESSRRTKRSLGLSTGAKAIGYKRPSSDWTTNEHCLQLPRLGRATTASTDGYILRMGFFAQIHNFGVHAGDQWIETRIGGHEAQIMHALGQDGCSMTCVQWNEVGTIFRLNVSDVATLMMTQPFAPLGTDEWAVPVTDDAVIDWGASAWPGLDRMDDVCRRSLESAMSLLRSHFYQPPPRRSAVMQSSLPW